MKFDTFTPQLLRDAIEKELERNPNGMLAAGIALRNLKKDPHYYDNLIPMNKAFFTKYKRRSRGANGKWNYFYDNDKKKQKKEIAKPEFERVGGMSFDNLTIPQIKEKLQCDFKIRNIDHDVSLGPKEVDYHIKCTIAGMSDLADVLKLPIQEVSGNGKLAFRYGHKEKWYDRNEKTINLIKQGKASLAHEWAHFIDNALTGMGRDELSHVAIDMDNEPEYKRLARRIADLSKRNFNNQISQIDNEDVRSTLEKDPDISDIAETFARSFEAYVTDKMLAAKRKNSYLVTPKKTLEAHGKILYPQGSDRKRLNELFDNFFEQLRLNNELQKAQEADMTSNKKWLLKIAPNKFLVKAKQHKYTKRTLKPGGGYDYTYPDDKKANKKGASWVENLMDIFSFKSRGEAMRRIEADYKKNKIDSKFNLSWDGWKNHLSEYFKNKEKWTKFFEQKTEKKDKKPIDKKPKKEKEKKLVVKKDSKVNLSVMRLIHGLYGKQEEVKKEAKVEEKQPEIIPPKEPAPGTKIKKDVKPTPAQTKEMAAEEKEIREHNKKAAPREQYDNEKPSEILNVGEDTWGARRHNYDTYNQFNYDLNEMEKDGTAAAFINKKNLFGKFGLADKDERVKKGETEYKVLMSYAIKKYLPEFPEKTGEKGRAAYYDLCRNIARLDQETTDAATFAQGLAEYADTHLKMKKDKFVPESPGSVVVHERLETKKEREQVDGLEILGLPIYAMALNILGTSRIQKMILMSDATKRDSKQVSVLDKLIAGEESGKYSYDDLFIEMFGAVKASGLKVKKGDTVLFTESLKNEIFALSTYFDNDEKEEIYKKAKQRNHDLFVHREDLSSGSFFDSRGSERGKIIIDRVKKEYGTISVEETFDEIDRQISEQKKIMSENINVKQIYPEEKGQIIKAGKKTITVSFKFADNKTRVFNVNPVLLKPENIESVKKDAKKTKGSKLDLFIEKKVIRKGGKNFNEMTTSEAQKKLAEDYKFKAVQYGNSMPDKERAAHTKWTIQAMSDLAGILNLPIEQVTANGRLGVAFGARGKAGGKKGLQVIAHYESVTKMINLTRANGFGSLAHEWGHFMDNILSDDAIGFVSSNPGYEERKNVPVYDIPEGAIYTRKARRGKKGLEVDYVYSPEKNKDYPWVKLDNGGLLGIKKPEQRVRFNFNSADIRVPKQIKYRQIAQEIAVEAKNEFIEKLNKADGDMFDKLSNPYWQMPQELFARAFETYISDKLHKAGQENTYLSSRKKTFYGDAAIVYPQGETRKKINKLFDEFFDEIRMNNELKKAIDLYFSENKEGMARFIKIGPRLFKAQQHKYTKRTPKSGGGYNYEYPDDKKADKKGGLFSGILSFFGFKDEKQAKNKIKQIYNSSPDIKNNFTVESYTNYLNEYLTNKEKWDNKLKQTPSPKKDKKPGVKKEGDKKVVVKKKDGTSKGVFNLSLMKMVVKSLGEDNKLKKISSGTSTGDVFKKGDFVYKKLINNEEYKTYEALKGTEGVSTASIEKIDGVDYIKIPFYEEIVSADYIKNKDEREAYKNDIFKNLNNITKVISKMSDLGLDYNDPLQFGYNPKNDKMELIDFSNVGKAEKTGKTIKEVRRNNFNHLTSFLNDFDLEHVANRIRETISFQRFFGKVSSDEMRIRMVDHKYRDEARELLKNYSKEKIQNAKYSYWTTNARPVQIPGVVQTDVKDNDFKMIFSPKPLSEKQVKGWELNPVYVSEQQEPAQKQYDRLVKERDKALKDFGSEYYNISDNGKIEDSDGKIVYEDISEYLQDNYALPESIDVNKKGWENKLKKHYENSRYHSDEDVDEIKAVKDSYEKYLESKKKIDRLKESSEELMGPKLFKARVVKIGGKKYIIKNKVPA